MTVDILLPGTPMKSERGFLGWCNVVLLRYDKKIVLFDTGSFGDRQLLLEALHTHGLSPSDVNIIVLSHLHYDHCLNYELFRNAQINVSAKEVDYALSNVPVQNGDVYVPVANIKIMLEGNVKVVKEGDMITKNIEVITLPGHTPGCIGLIVDKRIILTADAVKNAWDYKRDKPGICFGNEEAAVKSIKKVKSLVSDVIPGHDRRFVYDGEGRITYLTGLDFKIFNFLDPNKNEPGVFSVK